MINKDWIQEHRTPLVRSISRLLLLRLLLIFLTLWSLTSGDKKNERLHDSKILTEIVENPFLSLEFDATLHPEVKNNFKEISKAVAERKRNPLVVPGWEERWSKLTESEINLIAKRLGHEVDDMYSEAFGLKLAVLGNSLSIDLRSTIWLLPFLIIGIELFLTILRKKLKFVEYVDEQVNVRGKSSGEIKEVVLERAVREHPQQIVVWTYYFLSVLLVLYGGVLVMRLFPSAELWGWALTWIAFVYYGAWYLRYVSWFYDNCRGEKQGRNHVEDPLKAIIGGSLLRFLGRPVSLATLGNICLFSSLLLPMTCDGCGGTATGYEVLVEYEDTPLMAASYYFVGSFMDEEVAYDESEESRVKGWYWLALVSTACYVLALILGLISLLLILKSLRARLPSLLRVFRMASSFFFKLALFEFGSGLLLFFFLVYVSDFIDREDLDLGDMKVKVLFIMLTGLAIVLGRLVSRSLKSDGYLSPRVFQALISSFGVWPVLYFVMVMGAENILWGLTLYILGLYLIFTCFRKLETEVYDPAPKK